MAHTHAALRKIRALSLRVWVIQYQTVRAGEQVVQATACLGQADSLEQYERELNTSTPLGQVTRW
jgi:hypothetical protein